MKPIDVSYDVDTRSTSATGVALYTCRELADMLETQIQTGGGEHPAVQAATLVTFTRVPSSFE